MREFHDWDHNGSMDSRDGYIEYNRYRELSDSFEAKENSAGKLMYYRCFRVL